MHLVIRDVRQNAIELHLWDDRSPYGLAARGCDHLLDGGLRGCLAVAGAAVPELDLDTRSAEGTDERDIVLPVLE